MLSKDDVLFNRDEKGDLIPVKVVLDTPQKDEMLATPIVRGEFQRLQEEFKNGTVKNIDDEIILSHCVEPKIPREKINDMRPYLRIAIIEAILGASGLKPADKIEDALTEEEKNLKKK